MKRKALCLMMSLAFTIGSLNSQAIADDRYSAELGLVEPAQYDEAKDVLFSSMQNIDLELYRTVIRNGNIDYLKEPYLDDLKLGVLTKTELKLLRNMFYAKKGYVFSDEGLTAWFSQFDWYRPSTKKVDFTENEKQAIEKIRLFEGENKAKYADEKKDLVWEEFNGGADQRGSVLCLNRNRTFEYIPARFFSRISSVTGNWAVEGSSLVLYVTEENILLGGYAHFGPSGYELKGGTPASVKFKEPLKITLPVNESTAKEEYGLTFGERWLRIGSRDFYLSTY